MDIFCSDTKLNISPAYLKPGFAFGGSCLPKDIRALSYKGKSLDLDLPIINAIIPSNHIQIQSGIRQVLRHGRKRIGVLGVSFKAGTDDLRESPVVEMIEFLLSKGYDIKIYDKNVPLAALVGANKDYIMNRIPHIANLLEESMKEVVDHAEVIIIGNSSSEFKTILDCIRPDQKVIDLVRVVEDKKTDETYNGIAW
jgi:GDP-mannose 6-dehydrogenase